jgi:putative transferase (TIGR04331 family)
MFNKKSKFLITCADESTWVCTDKDVLFLGEWCRRYDRRHIWSKMDAVILDPYGLNNKTDDYHYIQGLKSQFVRYLADALNEFNQTDKSLRYWQIVLAQWPHRYISTLYNRYKTLELADKTYNISETSIVSSNQYEYVPGYADEFVWSLNSDRWNNRLYGEIIKCVYPGIKINIINQVTDKNNFFTGSVNNQKKQSNASSIMKEALYAMNRLAQSIPNTESVFIYGSYLPKKVLISLMLQLKQFPKLWFKDYYNKDGYKTNSIIREHLKSKINKDKHDPFQQVLYNLLYEYLPACYLEGHGDTVQQLPKLAWPQTPKYIFTSGSYSTDELFKVYTAENIEKGAKYFIGQHGNNFGTHKYAYEEDDCIEICDKFLTWGWKNENPKVSPLFNIKQNGTKRQGYNKHGGLLLIEMCIPQRFETYDIYPEHILYQQEQFALIAALNLSIRKLATVRLQKRVFNPPEWQDKLRWNDTYPDVTLCEGDERLSKLINECRLVIHSYDSTGILETLFHNIPTLAFWADGYDHLREDAIPFYELLEEAGIIHFSAESVALKINEIWPDISSWWHSDLVQEKRELFLLRLSKKEQMPARRLRKLFTNIDASNE